MAKKVTGYIKLQIPAGKATPVSYTHLDVYKRQVHRCIPLILYMGDQRKMIKDIW